MHLFVGSVFPRGALSRGTTVNVVLLLNGWICLHGVLD